jgi:hypothetical protein
MDGLAIPLVTWGNVPQAENMEAVDIAPGTPVIITDADGTEIQTTALSGIETDGHSFPVVWVERPLTAGGSDRVPWPLEAVRPG